MNIRIQKILAAAKLKSDPKKFLNRLLLARLDDKFESALVLSAYRLLYPEDTQPDIPPSLAHSWRVSGLMVLSGATLADASRTTLRATPRGLVTNYDDLLPPSDEARKENSVYRREQGMVHIGPRMSGLHKVDRKNRYPDFYGESGRYSKP